MRDLVVVVGAGGTAAAGGKPEWRRMAGGKGILGCWCLAPRALGRLGCQLAKLSSDMWWS